MCAHAAYHELGCIGCLPVHVQFLLVQHEHPEMDMIFSESIICSAREPRGFVHCNDAGPLPGQPGIILASLQSDTKRCNLFFFLSFCRVAVI